MRLYAAIDLHSNNSVLVVLDEEDRVVCEQSLPNKLAAILPQLAPYKERVQAVPERNRRVKRGPPEEDCQLDPGVDQYDAIDPPAPEE